jgi:hypothetical protein
MDAYTARDWSSDVCSSDLRCRRVLQRRAESPRKESEERRAQQRDGYDVGGRNARLRPDERQHGQKTDHRDA